MDNSFLAKVERLKRMRTRFPEIAAVEAVNFSKERFVQKNWLSRTREPWKKRSKEDRGSLMVRSGRLKRSIRKIKVTPNSVTIGTDVPYARIHNEGGILNRTVNVRQHTRTRKGRAETVKMHRRKMNTKMPKRQFIGESAILLRRIERLMEKEIKKALR